MKPTPSFSVCVASALLFGFSACHKAEKPQAGPVEKVENVNEVEVQKTAPVVAIPVISPGTWIGTLADGSEGPTLTIIPGNRLTIIQQESPTTGSYNIDPSKSPMILNFIADEIPGKSYFSQIQWIDDNTITMTSFADSPTAPAPVSASQPVPVASPSPAAKAEAVPFTGNVSAPVADINPPVATPSTDPVMDPISFTVTFRKQ